MIFPSASELRAMLRPDANFFPELEAAGEDVSTLRSGPAVQVVLQQTSTYLENIEVIPQNTYSLLREYRSIGVRKNSDTIYFQKRAKLSAAAVRAWLGEDEFLPIVQDYLWDICEESSWVGVAHEGRVIDLSAAETALNLAQTLDLLKNKIEWRVRRKVRDEVEARVLATYEKYHANALSWFQGHSNWNSVCNSSCAAAFLLLESDLDRVAWNVAEALRGLSVYLDEAFEADGASTEGVGYWHYGLMNFIVLAEMLYAKTDGQLNILGDERLKAIAAFPAKVQLSGMQFATFSDCAAVMSFHPGLTSRLALRTGEDSLFNFLDVPDVNMTRPLFRLPLLLRDIFWWDGTINKSNSPRDAVLPATGIARLTASTPSGQAVVLIAKAGHNAEEHNHNDVGSFILHCGEETFLTDPGMGLYTRQYFSSERYENIFANSFGHSVPRIGSTLQSAGREFAGTLKVHEGENPKQLEIELARAYDVPNLSRLTRVLELHAKGDATLRDDWEFSENPLEAETALVTWLDVETEEDMAMIRGEQSTLQLQIEEPANAVWKLEVLEEESRENGKSEVLKRLSFVVPAQATAVARVAMKWTS